MGSLPARDRLPPSPAAHNLRLCAQAPGFAGGPSASGSGRALGRGCSADTPPRPVTRRGARDPALAHTPPRAPTSAARPDEARGPTHSPWPRGRDALSRVAAFLCATPRAARASHSPPPPSPRAARLPAPSGARRALPAPGRFLRPAPLALRGGPRGGGARARAARPWPQRPARPRSARAPADAAPPADRAGICKSS